MKDGHLINGKKVKSEQNLNSNAKSMNSLMSPQFNILSEPAESNNNKQFFKTPVDYYQIQLAS